MDAVEDSTQREQLAELLRQGLATDWRSRAYTDEAIAAVIRRLRPITPSDYPARLQVAGFTPQPYRDASADSPHPEQECSSCMYFERHRGYCNQPAISLAVQPEWSCVLWRI